jgi:hypothetical protein
MAERCCTCRSATARGVDVHRLAPTGNGQFEARAGALRGDRHGLRREHFVGGMESDLRLSLDTCLGHTGPKTFLAELVERLFAFPGVNVVAISALPPGQVGDSADRRLP